MLEPIFTSLSLELPKPFLWASHSHWHSDAIAKLSCLMAQCLECLPLELDVLSSRQFVLEFSKNSHCSPSREWASGSLHSWRSWIDIMIINSLNQDFSID